MRKVLSFVVTLYLITSPMFAQQSLPIRRLTLYKNGMSYIVRTGQISAPLSLTFRPDEMNDVLKTFTAWNPDNSNLYPVGYTTGIAANEVLRRFPFDLRAPDNGLASFLQQIKGAGVKLDLGVRTVSGQLLAVESENRAVQQQTVVRDYKLTVLTATTVQTVWLSDVRSVDFQDPTLSAQLRSYLQVLADGQDVTRDVTVYPISATGPVNVSYVQQFPIWKTTYRLDLNGTGSHIQGWAQIDNPTGEAWNNVQLTLISGMPTSFTMDLYQPLYASRTNMRVPASIVAAPRQYEAATDTTDIAAGTNSIAGVVRDASGAVIPGVNVSARNAQTQTMSSALTDQGGRFVISNLAPGFYDVTASLPGFQTFNQRVQLAANGQSTLMPILQVGSVAESVTITGSPDGSSFGRGVIRMPGEGVGFGLGPAVEKAVAAMAPPPPTAQQTTQAVAAQDYFEYHFPFPVQLESRQSALLPFLNKPIKAERVSIYKAGADRDHPLHGAWIENNADLPLDAGPVTFFQSGRYAGETVMDYLSRSERRLVSYGVDYDVQVDTRTAGMPETTSKIVVSKGVMTIVRESAQTTNYRFRNKGQDARSLILEHPRSAQKILKDLKPEESTANVYRFRVNVAPQQEIEFPITETLSRQVTLSVGNFERSNVDLLLAGTDVPSELRAKLLNIVAERQKLTDLADQLPVLEESLDAIFLDQTRVRENLKALGSSGEEKSLRLKYLTELDAQEQRVRDTRGKIESLNQQIAQQQTLVARLISELTWGAQP